MQIPRFKILNTRDVKRIRKILEENYGFSGELKGVFLLNETKGRLYLISEDLKKIKDENIRTDNIGLYIGTVKDKGFRFTIEGSQIYGRFCNKNVIELGKENMKLWMNGQEIENKQGYEGYVVMKYKEDYLGSGKAITKKILNYIPKARRVPLRI